MEQVLKSMEGLSPQLKVDLRGASSGPGALMQVFENRNDFQNKQGDFGSALAAQRAAMEANSRPAERAAERATQREERAERASAAASERADAAEGGKDLPDDDPACCGDHESRQNDDPQAQAVGEESQQQASASEAETAAQAGDEPEHGDAAHDAAPVAQDADEPVAPDEITTAAGGEERVPELVAGSADLLLDGEPPLDAESVPDAEVVADAELMDASAADVEPVVSAGAPEPAAATVAEETAAAEAVPGVARSTERLNAARERGTAAADRGLATALSAGMRGEQTDAVVLPAEAAARAASVQQVLAAQHAGARQEFVSPERFVAAGQDQVADGEPAAVRQNQLNPESARPASGLDVSQLRQVVQERVSTAAQNTVNTVSQVASSNTSSTAQAVRMMAATAQQAGEQGLQQARVAVNQAGWEQLVASRVAMAAANGVQVAEIELDPGDLGPIRISIQVNNEHQQASVQFASHSASVRDALEQTAFRLREMFAEQGLDLGNVDVSDRGLAQDERATAEQQEHGSGRHGGGTGKSDREPQETNEPLAHLGVDGRRLVDYYA